MKIKALITHKRAETFRDCQDRFSVNAETKSMAVSDGMSQSLFQTYWADILANYYTNSHWHINSDSGENNVKKELSEKWLKRVQTRIEELKASGKNTVRAENSLASGLSACATLVGIRFKGQDWVGDVLGDSCIIEVKSEGVHIIRTSQESETFDNYPDYIDSNPDKTGKGKAKSFEGTLYKDTSLLLVSDPFSEFIAEKKKEGEASEYIRQLLDLSTHEQFEELVSRWRQDHGMHNDDSTLIVIEYDGNDSFDITTQDDIEKMIQEESTTELVAPAHQPITCPSSNVSESEFIDYIMTEFTKLRKEKPLGFWNWIYRDSKPKDVCKILSKALTNAYTHFEILRRK